MSVSRFSLLPCIAPLDMIVEGHSFVPDTSGSPVMAGVDFSLRGVIRFLPARKVVFLNLFL